MGFFAGPEQFVPRVELYHRAAEQAGHDPATLRLAVSGHMYIGNTSQGARDEFCPYYSRYFQQGGRAAFAVDGFPRDMYDSWIAHGLPVGSPQQVIDAIMHRVELLGIDRFLGQLLTLGPQLGVGSSVRYLAKQHGFIGNVLKGGAYRPEDQLLEMGSGLTDPGLGIEGLHLFSFNQVEETAGWQRRVAAAA
jgi:Luciferase-like monooxygenase